MPDQSPALARDKSWTADSVVVLSGTIVGAVLSALYVGAAARMLGPSEYGIVVALLAISSGLSIVLEPVENEIARVAADLVGKDRRGEIGTLFRYSLGRVGPASLALGLLLACIAPLLDGWLNLSSVTPALLFASYACGALLHCIPRALMRGLHHFGEFSANQVIEPIARFGSGLLAIKLGMGADGMLLGYTVGVFAATIIGLIQLRHILGQRSTGKVTTHGMSSVSAPFVVVTLYTIVVMNADVIVAKQELTANEAGLYGAASTLSRMGLIVAAPIAVVLLSKVASLRARGAATMPIVGAAAALVSTALGGGVFLAAVLGEWTMVLLYGPAFRPAAPLLLVLSATVALLVLQLGAAQVLLGLGRARGLWLTIVPTSLVLALLALNNDSPRAIALNGLVASAVGAVILSLLVLRGGDGPARSCSVEPSHSQDHRCR